MIDVVSKPKHGQVILKLRDGTLVGRLGAMHPGGERVRGECVSIQLLVAAESN